MSFQMAQEPGYEIPTCYRIENRFLTLRGALLILIALIVLWVVLVEPPPAAPTVLRAKITRGNPTPHVLLATLLLILGAVDLIAAALQRRVLLRPGQPASLTAERSRASTGASSGLGWLSQLMRGHVPPAALHGPYRRFLTAVAAHIAAAPTTLQGYLRVRVAHLMFAAGLLLALALTWLVISQPPTRAVAALFYSALAAGMVARSAWIAVSAPSPLAVAVALALAAVGAVLIAFFAARLPYVAVLPALGLPQAAALALGCMLLIEGLGLMAGRAHVDPPAGGATMAPESRADLVVDPDRLMHAVERELHRYWSDGIPNRRHAWQPPLMDANGDGESFSALVVEESQPVVPIGKHERLPGPTGERLAWLLALGTLSLLLTLAGGVLLVRLADAHMDDVGASWVTAASALVLVVAGGYALRVGHMLWSRYEVISLLLWLEFKGHGAHASGSVESAARVPQRGGGAVRAVSLKVSMVQVRSVFYAAAEHPIGSRVVLSLIADEPAARRSIQQLKANAEHAPLATVPAALEERPPFAPPSLARPAPPPARPASLPKFCSACGTRVLQGARFCQECGAPLG